MFERAVITAALVCWCGGWLLADEPHWAYQTPQRSAIPAFQTSAHIREPLDAFILDELARHNRKPSAEADRATLLRRLTLVLHGLFPSIAEIRSFQSARAPDAHEQQVDRLLASPLYGQRMASDWLDLARYADTHGFHADTEREHWPWRDWVIEQLNAGQPFDQFTLEQLAGDLLPGATLRQRMATGFHRNTMLNGENGAVPEEFLALAAHDRVATTGTVWLGQTFACARCHDHKYEALTQREFYGLVAFFNSFVEQPLLVMRTPATPRLAAPSREQQAALDKFAAQLGVVQTALQLRAQEAVADQQRWEQRAAKEKLNVPPANAAVHLPLDAAQKDRTPDLAQPQREARIRGTPNFVSSPFDEALVGDGQTSLELANWPALAGTGSWTLSAWIFPTSRDEFSVVAQIDEILYHRGVEWIVEAGHMQVRLTQKRGADELIVRSRQPVELSRWQHLAVVFDAKSPTDVVALWLNGKQLETESKGTLPTAGVAASGALRIGGTGAENCFRGMLDEVRLYGRALDQTEIGLLAGGDPVAAILQLPVAKRTPEQIQSLQRYYLEHHDTEHRRLSALLQNLRVRRDLVLHQVPTLLVTQEMSEPRPTFVLKNGQYDQPGERVQRHTPAYLSRQVPLARADRLGLARWLIDGQHPLTGRVGVNRAWQQVFGTGLVSTPDDFGVRGSSPSHPALLDWLAREWVDRGWDTKRLHRQIVSSATFRQRSEISPALADVDPKNRWLARGPRERLSAEAIRDSALGAAGLLNLAHGGPGVRPYQPGDLWKELAFDTSQLTAQTYTHSSGGAMYRRSVYLFWKRNSPPLNLTTFDAPNRETCTASRSRTNTPLQALVLLNDPTFVEAARVLAERLLLERNHSVSYRIDQLLFYVLSRPATAEEQTLLRQQLAADLEHYRADPAAADKLLTVGQAHVPLELSRTELAAWTNLAVVVLNLDEALTNH